MASSRVSSPQPSDNDEAIRAGIITRIHLENFMCHSSLDIEFGEYINFITGQNGSGKSAILTALCVAFGCRARGTQRAKTLKDFIKTGCSYALVQVEIKNQGPEAYKPDIYGDIIVVERRITESTSSLTLKNCQGRKVGIKREDLRELIEHYNIDVENPCVFMSQDKSREFLNSGSAKDKFKFFYKATLLQRVDDLLKGIDAKLSDAAEQVKHLEESLRPVLKELDELQEKINGMKFVGEISLKVQLLRKKLAWAWVYESKRELDEKDREIEKWKGGIPSCQTRINEQHHNIEALSDQLAKKESDVSILLAKASDVRRMRDEQQHLYSTARSAKTALEYDRDSKTRQIQSMRKTIALREQLIHEQKIRDTQDEENEKEKLRVLEVEFDEANGNCQRLKADEDNIAENMVSVQHEIQKITERICEAEKKRNEFSRSIQKINRRKKNKVTAFGGEKVISLLRAIEDNQHKFHFPPIGPIGSHLKLEKEDWSTAVESAVGRFFNSFIVTDFNDSRTLRALATSVKYTKLHIVIYDFSRKRLEIPHHMLPQTHHPTVFSVLHSDNDVVHNVLIDLGNTEQQVLLSDYAVGETVVFNPRTRVLNAKEVYTYDGTRIFQRRSAQTVLPPHWKLVGRLCASYDEQIKELESNGLLADEEVKKDQRLKTTKHEELKDQQEKFDIVKRKRQDEEREMMRKKFKLQDSRNSVSATPASDADLHQEISILHEQIQGKQTLVDNLEIRINEEGRKAEDLDVSVKELCESAKVELDVLSEAESEIVQIKKYLLNAEATKKHYQKLMDNTVIPELKKAEIEYGELENKLEENRKKASIICPESEVDGLGCEESKPEQLSPQLSKLYERLERESRRYPEPIKDLRKMLEKKQRKISRKQQTYKALKEKLDVLEKALEMRWSKFHWSAEQRIAQLTWGFNAHLKKKGISGAIKVNAKEQTLAIEVIMPQDASNSTVRDTRGLSGGERSFSTLCFSLTLHEMTEAPFRAMDEFDVFMDAVSRKISMDALVDFALEEKSQWIFITPHDISLVKNDKRIKKQQMAAPRG